MRESKAGSVLLQLTKKHITCRLRLCVCVIKACRDTYMLTIYMPINTLAIESLQRGMASLDYLAGMISTLRVSRQARAWQAGQ